MRGMDAAHRRYVMVRDRAGRDARLCHLGGFA